MAKHAILRIDNMQATYDFSLLRSGLFYADDELADVDNGTAVEVGALLENERELRKLVAAADATNVIGIVTTPELDSTLDVETSDLAEYYTKAGTAARVHLLQMGDIFSLSVEGFTAAPTVGAEVGVTDGKWDTAAETKIGKCIAIDKVSGTDLYVIEIAPNKVNQ